MNEPIIFRWITAITSLITTVLAFYAIVVKRKELFKGSIYNKQVDELISIRQMLQSILFQVHFTHFWADNIVSLNRSIKDFEQEQPEDWQAYRKFQEECKYIMYAFMSEENGLMPKWFKLNNHKDLVAILKGLEPFTFSALSKKKSDEILTFQNLLLKKIAAIDKALHQQA